MKNKLLCAFLFGAILFSSSVSAQTNETTRIKISLLEEIATNYNSHVYMNSLTNKLSIDFKENNNPITLKLSSENGLLIYSKEGIIDEDFIEFETSSLKQGSYSLNFYNQKGQLQKKYQV